MSLFFSIRYVKLSNEQYLTEVELFNRWAKKVAIQTLRNWRSSQSNKGPAYVRFGGRVLYPLDKLVEYESRSLIESGNQEVAAS